MMNLKYCKFENLVVAYICFVLFYVECQTSEDVSNLVRDFGSTIVNAFSLFQLLRNHFANNRQPVDWEHIRKVWSDKMKSLF